MVVIAARCQLERDGEVKRRPQGVNNMVAVLGAVRGLSGWVLRAFWGETTYTLQEFYGNRDLFYCHIAETQQCRVCGWLLFRQRAWNDSACGKLFVRSRLVVLRAIFMEVGALKQCDPRSSRRPSIPI
jgi:hypothetical protein